MKRILALGILIPVLCLAIGFGVGFVHEVHKERNLTNSEVGHSLPPGLQRQSGSVATRPLDTPDTETRYMRSSQVLYQEVEDIINSFDEVNRQVEFKKFNGKTFVDDKSVTRMAHMTDVICYCSGLIHAWMAIEGRSYYTKDSKLYRMSDYKVMTSWVHELSKLTPGERKNLFNLHPDPAELFTNYVRELAMTKEGKQA